MLWQERPLGVQSKKNGILQRVRLRQALKNQSPSCQAKRWSYYFAERYNYTALRYNHNAQNFLSVQNLPHDRDDRRAHDVKRLRDQLRGRHDHERLQEWLLNPTRS